MLNGYILTSLLIAISFVVVGLAVFLRNPKKALNRTYLLFSIFIGIWLISNYLGGSSEISQPIALISNRVLFVFAGLSALAMLLFTFILSGRKLSYLLLGFLSLGVFFSVTGGSSLVVKDVFLEKDTYAIDFGILADGYFAIVVISLVWATAQLLRARKRAKISARKPIDTILKGIAVASLGILTSNVLLPFGFDIYSLTDAGSYFSAFIVFSMAYAIIKHRLFDIRLVVARSIAYIFSIGLVIIVYAFVSSTITSYIDNAAGLVVNAAVVATAILSYPFVKRFFDKATNRLFYRDAYEPQQFLDELNKTLVGSIELEVLSRHTAQVVEKNLKCSSCQIAVMKTENTPLRVFGVEKPGISPADTRELEDELRKHHAKITVSDDLGSHHGELRKLLKKHDISLVANLTSGHGSRSKPLAYLLLGPKKSGNIYNKQDLRIIEIIADELVIAIQNALRFEEIQGFAATLQEKVNQATAQLQKTNKKLRELDETKDEFISMASHQLRTPLTSVKGYTSMVLEGDAGKLKKQQKQLLDQAFISSQRMVYLIADLLNVSRLKTGKFVIDSHPVNLADVVEGEISQLRETAKRKNLNMTYRKPEKFPMLMLDETKTRQVIMNFADNAIYYTPSGGDIDIILKEDNKNIYFTVKDSGIGVPRKEKEHMFTKFYRAKNARKARPDGTGLGLFMAKKVVDAQAGQILFESEEGRGSTFGFCFSKSKLAVDGKK